MTYGVLIIDLLGDDEDENNPVEDLPDTERIPAPLSPELTLEIVKPTRNSERGEGRHYRHTD